MSMSSARPSPIESKQIQDRLLSDGDRHLVNFESWPCSGGRGEVATTCPRVPLRTITEIHGSNNVTIKQYECEKVPKLRS
jgi:hypothetical protein